MKKVTKAKLEVWLKERYRLTDAEHRNYLKAAKELEELKKELAAITKQRDVWLACIESLQEIAASVQKAWDKTQVYHGENEK